MEKNIASIKLCNLVSGGMTVGEAKKRLGMVEPAKVVEPVKVVAPVEKAPTDFDTKKELQSALRELGIPFSPNAGIKNLQAKLTKSVEEADIL